MGAILKTNFTTCKTRRFFMDIKLKSFGTIILVGLMVSFFPLVFHQSPVWAVCPDSDNDGFCDTLESSSSNFYYNGTAVPPGTFNSNTRDVFVVIKPASGSNYFSGITYLAYLVGLPSITFHVIPATYINDNINDPINDRLVISGSTQKAIRIVEDLGTGGDTNIMGISSCGTPNGDDSATIYTQNIMTMLKGIYGSNPIPDSVRISYIQHIIAHEIGHMIGPLAAVAYSTKLGGYHYAPGSGNVMDQSVQYKNANWTIGTTFTTADKNGIKLK
jgi:hypothetical protein